MHIVLATSEVAPYAKAGGLGEVCAALAREFCLLGHQVTVFVPAYASVLEVSDPPVPAGVELNIPVGGKTVVGTLLRGALADCDADVYLVRQDGYFARNGMYNDDDGFPYRDNCERFAFFCRAVLSSIASLSLEVDVIHAHDWPTGLISACLATEFRHTRGYEQIACVYTVHDVSFQGNFWHWDMLLTGLDWKYFNWRQMEFFGQLSLLKSGVVFADAVTTVSERYAQDIQTAAAGCGLEGVFRERRQVLHGICRGIDPVQWDPQTDTHLPSNYAPRSLQGKADCKAALRKQLSLPDAANSPLVAVVGPIEPSASSAIAATLISQWCDGFPAQWIVAPNGDAQLQRLTASALQFPERLKLVQSVDDDFLRLLMAGSDMLLIPDRTSPSGWLHLVAMRYGAIPVARAVGDLADTIQDATDKPQPGDPSPSGFLMSDCTPETLAQTMHRACAAFNDAPAQWQEMMAAAMTRDVSWRRSAKAYLQVFAAAGRERNQPVTV